MVQWTLLEWLMAAGAVAAIVMVVVGVLAWLFPNRKSTILPWKGWSIVPNWYRYYQRKWRMARTEKIMRSKLDGSRLTILIRTYESCLADNQRTSKRDMLRNITPEEPSWLNDCFVVSALESLWNKGEIVKATKFELNGFPPRPESYLFLNKRTGTTAKQQADAIETEGQCLVHQLFRQCLKDPRHETGGRPPETMAPGNTQFFTQVRLREDAPPCSRCWDIEEHRKNIRLLVDDITKYDLAASAPVEITGMDREFQEAVIAICIERQCAAEVATVKKIVERAIEIRGSQLCHLPIGDKMDWTEELTKEFTACLHEYIKTEVQ